MPTKEWFIDSHPLTIMNWRHSCLYKWQFCCEDCPPMHHSELLCGWHSKQAGRPARTWRADPLPSSPATRQLESGWPYVGLFIRLTNCSATTMLWYSFPYILERLWAARGHMCPRRCVGWSVRHTCDSRAAIWAAAFTWLQRPFPSASLRLHGYDVVADSLTTIVSF